MSKTETRTERRRVTAEDVRNNAKQGGGQNWFTLPDGVRTWQPEKAGSYTLNFLPYEIKIDNHPDKMEKGTIWYKFPFQVHHQIGAQQESIVCPATVGKRCPICEEKARLAKNWDENEEAIKAVNAQRYIAFNIQDPDDEGKVAVFAMSAGKFWDFKGGGLKKELEEGDDKNLLFYETTKDGKTMKVRFSEEEFAGRKFLRASRFDFSDRKAMDEDEVLAKTVCLDTMWDGILPYEAIQKIFLQTNGEPAKAAESPGKTGDTPRTSTKWKLDDQVQFTDGKKTITGKIIEIDEDDVVVEDDEGEEHDADIDDLKPVVAKETPKAAEKPAATSTPASAEALKIGDTVKDEDNITGKVIKIKGDDVTYQDAKGTKYVEDIEDLTRVKEPEPEKPKSATQPKPSEGSGAKKGDMVSFTVDGERLTGKIININAINDATIKCDDGMKHVVDIDEVEVNTTTPTDAKPLAIGDTVEWDDGTEEGEIVKISGDTARVKDEDGDILKVPLKDLKRK